MHVTFRSYITQEILIIMGDADVVPCKDEFVVIAGETYTVDRVTHVVIQKGKNAFRERHIETIVDVTPFPSIHRAKV